MKEFNPKKLIFAFNLNDFDLESLEHSQHIDFELRESLKKCGKDFETMMRNQIFNGLSIQMFSNFLIKK